MTQELHESELRASKRGETDEAAVIFFPNGPTRVSCRLLNRSEGGVLLEVGTSAQFPSEFILIAGTPETRVMCRLAWRIGSRVGCEFISRFSTEEESSDWVLPVVTEPREMLINSSVLKRALIIS